MIFLPTLGKFDLDFTYENRFRLFSCREIFSEESFLALQKAFSSVPWVRKEDDFYVQYESFVKPEDTHALASLYSPSFFFPFKETLEKQLGVSLQNRMRLAAHKLITSDEIGIHNDYSLPEEGHENFRFIFQFSQENELYSGGELFFWASKYTREVIKKYPYGRNVGICFEITPHSFHSVAPVNGERLTLVMYLWKTGSPYNELSIQIS